MAKNDIDQMISRLRTLYNSDDKDYSAFFDRIAQRGRRRWDSDVELIRLMLVNTTRQDAIAVAKEMHEIGVATFVRGRRGAETRLEWRFRMDIVGQVARGDHDNLGEASEEREEGETAENAGGPDDSASEPAAGTLAHSFRLRPNGTVTFHLPADLTETEARRLGDFIKSLPFERVQ